MSETIAVACAFLVLTIGVMHDRVYAADRSLGSVSRDFLKVDAKLATDKVSNNKVADSKYRAVGRIGETQKLDEDVSASEEDFDQVQREEKARQTMEKRQYLFIEKKKKGL